MSLSPPASPAPPEASQYRAALERYFRRRANPADVEDLVQQVMLSLYSRRDAEPILNFEAYLFSTASRALARYARRRAALGWTELDEPLRPDDAQISAERILIGRQRLSTVVSVIAERMPPRTRQVFVLHRFEEMTYPAIAAALGISVSTVEKHIMLGLKLLVAAVKETP
jgi:RNA polymerase sigma factor (sigma-70 family)